MVKIEEEGKTLKYQETMNLEIENIAITNKQVWRSVYDEIHDEYFKAVKLFPAQCSDHCKKRTSKHTKLIESSFKKDGFVTRVVFTSGYDTKK